MAKAGAGPTSSKWHRCSLPARQGLCFINAFGGVTPQRSSTEFLTPDTIDLSDANETRRATRRPRRCCRKLLHSKSFATILSFAANFVVGIRRTILLLRKQPPRKNTRSSPTTPTKLPRRRHLGVEHSEKELHKMCALLAGLCISLASKVKDSSRGCVCRTRAASLPRNATARPGASAHRLHPSSNEWLVTPCAKTCLYSFAKRALRPLAVRPSHHCRRQVSTALSRRLDFN